jgi:CheY-like chemotaxis protein
MPTLPARRRRTARRTSTTPASTTPRTAARPPLPGQDAAGARVRGGGRRPGRPPAGPSPQKSAPGGTACGLRSISSRTYRTRRVLTARGKVRDLGYFGSWRRCRCPRGGLNVERARVLIADDHTLFRDGLKALLGSVREIDVVGEAATGNDAVAGAAAVQPDVILMDLQMPVLWHRGDAPRCLRVLARRDHCADDVRRRRLGVLRHAGRGPRLRAEGRRSGGTTQLRAILAIASGRRSSAPLSCTA